VSSRDQKAKGRAAAPARNGWTLLSRKQKCACIDEGDPAKIKLMGDSQIVRGKVRQPRARVQRFERSARPARPATVFTQVRLIQGVPVRVRIDQLRDGVRLVAGITATVQVGP
jgi:multidrug resistance efflux pump